jgi:hypothetical protein
MQQFARVFTGKEVVPVVLKGNEHLDLRPVVSDITPETIARGALANVDTARLSAINGDFTYLAPIDGVRQIAATGFNYKKHIAEFKMKPPTEPEVFLKAIGSLAGPIRPDFPRPQSRGETRLGDRTGDCHRSRSEGHQRHRGVQPHFWVRLSKRRFGSQHAGRYGASATSGACQVAADIQPHRPLSDDWHRCDEAGYLDQAKRKIRAAGQHQRHAFWHQRDGGLLLHPYGFAAR